MQKTRGTALLAASLLVMGGLSACGDEGGEASESSSTASPSAPEKTSSSESSDSESDSSASETSEASGSGSSGSEGGEVAELPAAAKKQTKAGAIAFNEFYQEQLGESLKSGDTATVEKYTHKCGACDNFNEQTEANMSRGITMDRNPYSVHNLTATPRTDSGMKVAMTVKSSGYREVLADGSKGRKADPTSYKLISDTQWHDGHWVIRNTVIVK